MLHKSQEVGVYMILHKQYNKQHIKHIKPWCRGLELFNSWTLTAAEQKKLLHYWQNFETYVKPQANQIMARYKLYCLKQNLQSVDIWLTSASELATESGYTVNIRDEMLRDHIVFATNSEMVRTKCLEVGDDLINA